MVGRAVVDLVEGLEMLVLGGREVVTPGAE